MCCLPPTGAIGVVTTSVSSATDLLVYAQGGTTITAPQNGRQGGAGAKVVCENI